MLSSTMKTFILVFSFVLLSNLHHHVVTKGVTRCYYCNDKCSDPLSVEECSNANEVDYVCMSFEKTSTVDNTTTSIMKGCFPNTITEVCKESDKSTDASCYTCNEDLCNHGVERCYTCQGTCNDLWEQECPTGIGDFVCTSYTVTNNEISITNKGCYSSTFMENCKEMNKTDYASCYTCYQDLCNYNVKQCYKCQDLCNDTLEIENCPVVNGVDYVCMSSEVTLSNTTTLTQKGCFPQGAIESCKSMDEESLSWCNTCHEDLCNGKNDGNSVKKCYHCNGTCNMPLDLEECPPSVETDYVCMASKIKRVDGTTSETRGCVTDSFDTISECDTTNQTNGNSCYICKADLCNNVNDNDNDNDDDGGGNAAGTYSTFLLFSTSALLFVIIF